MKAAFQMILGAAAMLNYLMSAVDVGFAAYLASIGDWKAAAGALGFASFFAFHAWFFWTRK